LQTKGSDANHVFDLGFIENICFTKKLHHKKKIPELK